MTHSSSNFAFCLGVLSLAATCTPSTEAPSPLPGSARADARPFTGGLTCHDAAHGVPEVKMFHAPADPPGGLHLAMEVPAREDSGSQTYAGGIVCEGIEVEGLHFPLLRCSRVVCLKNSPTAEDPLNQTLVDCTTGIDDKAHIYVETRLYDGVTSADTSLVLPLAELDRETTAARVPLNRRWLEIFVHNPTLGRFYKGQTVFHTIVDAATCQLDSP